MLKKGFRPEMIRVRKCRREYKSQGGWHALQNVRKGHEKGKGISKGLTAWDQFLGETKKGRFGGMARNSS